MAEADTTKPVLTLLTLPVSVDVTGGGKSATFTTGATDIGTGVDYVAIKLDRSFRDANGNSSDSIFVRDSTDSFADGSSSLSPFFGSNTSAGTYGVEYVSVRDKAGNFTFYYTSDLASKGFVTSFQVIDRNVGPPPPTASITAPISIAEDGGQALALSVVLANVSQASGTVTMSFAAAQSTVTNGSDVSVPSYTGSYNIVQSPAGTYVINLPSISVLADQVAEGTETLAVTIRASGQVFDTGTDTKTVSVKLIDSGQTGGAGADRLTGTRFADELSGFAGNDVLKGGGGDDRISGGAGIDTAVFDGGYRQASITRQAGEVTVVGQDGRDTLTSMERFQFTDGVLVFDPDSAGAQVMRMYDTVLGRQADGVGLDYWVDRMEDTGLGLGGVAAALASSAEFQQATGGLGNASFVEYVYQRALGRGADAGGRDYWTGRLDAGLSRGDMLVGFSESAEHRTLTSDTIGQGYFQTDDTAQAVALLYDSFTGRQPDLAGLAFWTEQIKTGSYALLQVADAFAASGEFQTAIRGKSNGQLVDFMYQNTLDRGPDGGGRAFWVDQLDRGLTQGQLLLHFSQSAEHAQLIADQIIGGVDIIG